MTQLIIQISDHPILKTKRAIRLKQISCIDFDIMFAKVLWEEIFLDEKGEPIMDETVKPRIIESVISNESKVTAQGIVIDSENFPKLESETDEGYQERINKIESFPEFDFYIQAVLNTPAIGQAIQILDSLKRFNRR